MEALGAELAQRLEPDGTLLLYGDLGAGKTVLVRGLAAALGVPGREVQSPTFTIVREHEAAGTRLIHVDLYRLNEREVEAMGLEETLAGGGVKAVEWAERLPFPVAAGSIRIRIERLADGRRRVVEDTPLDDV